MTQALSVYLANALSTEYPTVGSTLYTASGSPASVAPVTTINGNTGYGEVFSQGTATAWASGSSIGAQSGRGFFLDASTLDLQELLAGSYSAVARLGLQNATGVVNFSTIVRVSKYGGGTYTTIVTMTQTGCTLSNTTSPTNFTPSGSTSSPTTFAVGDRLYVDYWLNITSNTSATGQQIRIAKVSTDTTGLTGDPNAVVVTPGYVSGMTAIAESLSSLDAVATSQTNGNTSITEQLTSADALITGAGSGSVSVTEQLTTADATTIVQANGNTTITEQISSADAVAVIAGSGTSTVTEQISSADAVTVVQTTITTTVIEQLSSLDAVATLLTGVTTSIVESIGITNVTATVQANKNTTITEQLVTPDAVASSVGSGAVSVVESLVSGDALATSQSSIGITITEQLGSFDAVVSTLAGSGAVSIVESSMSPDAVTTIAGNGTVSASQQLMLFDAVALTVGSNAVSIVESMGTPDAVATTYGGSDNPYGFTIFCGSQSAILKTQDVNDVLAAGAKWIRFQPPGYVIETSPGVYNWSVLDDAVAKCNATGINISTSIHRPPSWGLQTVSCGGGTFLPLASWMQSFGTALATRYNGQNGHGHLDAIEVGNEDYSQATSTCRTYDMYTPALLATAPALRNAGYTGRIGCAALLTDNYFFIRDWIAGLYSTGAAALVDYLNFHFYRAGGVAPGNTTVDDHSIDNFWGWIHQACVVANDPNKDIWITETGYPTFVDANNPSANVITQAQQAAYLQYSLDSARNSGCVTHLFVYTLDGSSTNNDAKSLTQGLGSSETHLPAFTTLQTNIANYPNWTQGRSVSIVETLTTADAIATIQGATTLAIVEQVTSFDAIAIPLGTAAPSLYKPIANDIFNRANQSGFGTATDGNSWYVDSGAATLAVVSNQGQVTGVTSATFLREGTNLSADFDVTVQASGSSTNYTSFGVFGRQTGVNTAYRARINTNNSSIGFAIVKTIAGVATNLVTMSFTASLNTLYNIRFKALGTALFAKVWAINTVEPTSWMLSTTDSGITGVGTVGLTVSTTSSADVALFDNFYAIDYSEHEQLFTFDAEASTVANIAYTTSITEQLLTGDALAVSVSGSAATTSVTGQLLALSNTGTDDGTWTATSNASWLLASPMSGTIKAGDSTTITVSTNSDALGPGTYTGTLTLVMSNANTVQIPVSLTVVSSSSAPQSVTLTNTGGASGVWNASLSSGASWLSLSALSGTLAAGASTVITVYAQDAGMAPGTYTANITFSIAGANSVNVPITLTVDASTSADIDIAPSSLTFTGIVGTSSATNTRTVTLTNPGNESGSWQSSIVYNGSGSGWLALTPAQGTLPATSTQVVTLALVNTAALAAGSYSAVVSFLMGSEVVTLNVTLVMQTTTPQAMQTVLIAEQQVTVEWPLVVTNKIDEMSTADFTILDTTDTLNILQNAQVIINDSQVGVVFKGYIATVESNTRLYPNPHIEYIVACKDERYLAAKRLFTGKDYTSPRLAGDIVADLMSGYLTPEGVSASYAIRHDNSTATFTQGTLTNTVANNDIELAAAGRAYALSDNFQSGTLNKVGVSNSALQLAQVQAIKIVGTASQGVSSQAVNQQGNNYCYFKIWGGNVSIASGDSLQYGVWISSTSPQIMSSVDGICTDGTTLRDYQNRYLLDQNHLASHPGTDLSGYANDQWYFRTIDLSPIAGKALGTISVAFEGDNSGMYTSYFRAIRLVSSGGSIKQTFFDSGLASNQLLSNIGYSAVALSQLPVYEQSGVRVSSASNIGGVGVVQSSSVAWTTDATTPKNTALVIESSIDNGATWQACTSGQAIPSLLVGANAQNITIVTRQRLSLTGASPELTPNLYALSWSVTPSYACTKTDVLKIETTQADFAGGSNTAILASSNGDLSLNGSWRDWHDASTNNQTFFGNGSQTVVTRQCAVTIAPNGQEGRSRLDFAGSWQDFTAEVDVTVSPHGNASFVYRTTNWQTANNYHAYNVDLTQTQILFGRGSSSGTYTQIATANVDLSKGTVFRLTVVASGSNHRIYVDGTLYINATDSTYVQSGQFGLRFLNNDPSVTYSGFFGNFGVVQALTGTHISNPVPLTPNGIIGATVAQWDADIPQGGTVDVAVSFDRNTWTSCTNGAAIPGLSAGTTNTHTTLYVRTTVASGNAAANTLIGRDLNTYLTPTVHGVTLLIAAQLNATGTRVSPVLQLDTVGIAGSSSVSWTQVAGAGTSVGVDISLNRGASWTDVTQQNGGAIPGINEGDSMVGKSVLSRIRLTSTVAGVTPQVTDLTVSVRNSDIQSGFLIPSTSYAFQNKIDSCLDDLASKSNYWWAIKNGRLLFQNRAGIPAPWVLDSADTSQYYGEQQIGDILLTPVPRLSKQSDKYRNRHWITNVLTPTSAPVTEQKVGDGKTQSWKTTYPIAGPTSSITLTRNGNPVSIGIQGVDIGKDFYYTPTQSDLVQNPNVAPLAAANGATPADTLSIIYTGLTLSQVMAEDTSQQQALAAIDGTTGIIEEVEDASTLYPNGLLADAAQQLAQARITQFATLGREWQSSTMRGGLDAGMLQTVNEPKHGLNNVPMLITEIKINYMEGMTRYDVKYVEGYNRKSWMQAFNIY